MLETRGSQSHFTEPWTFSMEDMMSFSMSPGVLLWNCQRTNGEQTLPYIFKPLNSKLPPPPLHLLSPHIFFLKLCCISELRVLPLVSGKLGQVWMHTPPPYVARPFLGESPSHCLGSWPSRLGPMKSVVCGLGWAHSGPCPHPAEAQAYSWQLWLQLCCYSLLECVTTPNVPGWCPRQGA